MGMDLDFWKYKEGASHNDGKVYEIILAYLIQRAGIIKKCAFAV